MSKVEFAPNAWMPTEERVNEAMENGGWWQSCSGCHETNEGYETGWYPYSPAYRCYVGAGCHECGGIGVIWCQGISDEDLAATLHDVRSALTEEQA